MSKSHKIHGIGIIQSTVVFLAMGLLAAVLSVVLQTGPTLFLRAFFLVVVPAGIIYAIVSRATSNAMALGSGVMLIIVGGVVGTLLFETQSASLPFRTVPMALYGGLTLPGVTSQSYAIPDALIMIFVAVILGFTFAAARAPNDDRKGLGPTMIATAIVLFAVASILMGIVFGVWGEWMILITPLTGFPYLGIIISIAYVALGWLIWKKVSIAFWIYLGLQIVAIAEALILGLWFSIIFSVPIIVYIILARKQFKKGIPTPEIADLSPIH